MLKKRTSTILLTIVLLAAVVAGATFAWLSFGPVALNNVFTYSTSDVPGGRKDQAVAIQLAEPRWKKDLVFGEYLHNNGSNFLDRLEAEPGNKYYNMTDTLEKQYGYGETAAKEFTPGSKMLKNPVVKAIGYEPTYVGVKVSGAGKLTLAQLETALEIDWDVDKAGSKWLQVNKDANGDRYFVYKETLYPVDLMGRHGGKYDAGVRASQLWTTELFTCVQAKNNSIKEVQDIYDLFAKGAAEVIKVEAFAVQAINDSVDGWNDDNGEGAKKAFIQEFGSTKGWYN